jgi:hypothetical protein
LAWPCRLSSCQHLSSSRTVQVPILPARAEAERLIKSLKAGKKNSSAQAGALAVEGMREGMMLVASVAEFE